VVNEIIVVFLGTLPLDRHPESKPFTPSTPAWAPAQGNASPRRDHPRTHGRISYTRLNAVRAACRNRVKPASAATSRIAASPAWAPSA